MSDKEPTQAMPSESGSKVPPDATELATEGDASPEKGAESSGGRYPNARRRKGGGEGEDWHGGQSVAGYHGTGQLGEQQTRPGGNPNSGAKD